MSPKKTSKKSTPKRSASLPELLVYPFQDFFKQESSGGIVLMIATLFALLWANSPWSDTYVELWETPITFGNLSKPLIIWINDGLMAIFFFVVGLEIKREIQTGELSSWRTASLPVMAALGGMIFPALIFFFVNKGQPWAHGWGIPMATDIAFSLGVLSLLGKRVPLILKVFLAAFAIADDLGAVLVIAVFYSHDLHLNMLALGGVFFLVAVVFNFFSVRSLPLYIIVGAAMWYCFLKSGVHPTVAGVLLAFTIPSNPKIRMGQFVEDVKCGLKEFVGRDIDTQASMTPVQLASVEFIHEATKKIQSPSQRVENGLHSWVTWFIMPIFAVANAGVVLGSGFSAAIVHPLTLSLGASLIFGKLFGITLFIWISLKVGLSPMPKGVKFIHFVGLSLLGGIGFTMSLFITNLAFENNTGFQMEAKTGILIASILAGIIGYVLLNQTLKEAPAAEEATPSSKPEPESAQALG